MDNFYTTWALTLARSILEFHHGVTLPWTVRVLAVVGLASIFIFAGLLLSSMIGRDLALIIGAVVGAVFLADRIVSRM